MLRRIINVVILGRWKRYIVLILLRPPPSGFMAVSGTNRLRYRSNVFPVRLVRYVNASQSPASKGFFV